MHVLFDSGNLYLSVFASLSGHDMLYDLQVLYRFLYVQIVIRETFGKCVYCIAWYKISVQTAVHAVHTETSHLLR